jgi:hypothetical protein
MFKIFQDFFILNKQAVFSLKKSLITMPFEVEANILLN